MSNQYGQNPLNARTRNGMSNAQKSFSLDPAGNPIPPDNPPKLASPRVHRPSTPKSRLNNARNNAQKKCDRNQLRSLQDTLGTGNYQTWANSDKAVEARLMAIARWQAEMSSARAGLQEADKLSIEVGVISVREEKEGGKEEAKEASSDKAVDTKENGDTQ